MFSPSLNEGGPATATRSRRRQRPLSSESLAQQPKAKRQRQRLTELTFINPEPSPEMLEVKSDNIAKLSARQDGISHVPGPKKELSVRSKKPKAGERLNKGDGSIVLTTNNAFTVSKLPALPDRMRADWASKQHGTINSLNGYAVWLTHTHALVWPYTATVASPESFNFTLPYPSKHVSDPLPLGALVSSSATSEEPGLVVVMPVSGKITYWESISSAATLDFLRQQRNGVEGAISGMFSGEYATQIVDAESGGFILVFSSGRLAYLSVRDGQGRPAISIQFLRSNLGSVGGLFGSIRNALKQSAIRGDIAAVRADHSNKVGERIIVAATSKGKLETWRVHRGGHHDAVAEADAREAIVKAVVDVNPALGGFSEDLFEIVDFTFVSKGIETKYINMTRLSEAMASQDESVQHLLLLVSFTSKRHSQYSLVEVVFSAQSLKIGMVRLITSYNTPTSNSTTQKPRLYLPKPALVAFVIFDSAVVLASLAMPLDSPDAQLQEDVHVYPASFEDVIDLRSEDNLEIVGSGVEDPFGSTQEHDISRSHRHKTKNPTAVVLVRGFGVVRVATTDIDRFASERPPRVTAKSKLEQAVFFGHNNDNPLVFEGRRELGFTNKEIGEAALNLSHDILSSKSPHLPSLPASVTLNLRTRVTYLDRLMSHLKALKIDLDRRTRWALLADAEKMIVAIGIWQQHEQFMAGRADGDKKSLVSEIVEYIHEDEKKNPNPATGELDRVRYWFIHDVWRMEIFVAWAYQMIKYVHKEQIVDDIGITRLIYEAMQINRGSLHDALEYRLKRLSFYGLAGEHVERSGILVDGYEGLREPWTANVFIVNNIKRLVELCTEWLDQYYPPRVDAVRGPDPGLIESIRDLLPDLMDSYLNTLREQSLWAEISEDPKSIEFSNQCRKTYLQDRYLRVYKLRKFGLWTKAIEVAEKHHCLVGMADLMVEEVCQLQKLADKQEAGSRQATELLNTAEEKEKRIGDCFEVHGKEFAFAAYEAILEQDNVRTVLDFRYDKVGYRTQFLRSKPELAKISWMNDILREKNIPRAAETLLDTGFRREQKVWNKKIELSLGKLAIMAESEQPSRAIFPSSRRQAEARNEASLEKVDKELEIIRIQDKIYRWIYPTIDTAIDTTAEVQFAMENHATKIPKKQKVLLQMFENAMGRLLTHDALEPFTLVDLLSLIYFKHSIYEFNVEVYEDQFFLALQVAEYGLQGDERRQAQRLIWRRCYLRDDWAHINNTELQDDIRTMDVLGKTAAYQTMFACYGSRRDQDDIFPVIKPSEALGVYTDNLDARFTDMEAGIREKLLDCMRTEDTKLASYVERSRLEEWYRETLAWANREWRLAINEQMVAGAATVSNSSRSDLPLALRTSETSDPVHGNGTPNLDESCVRGLSTSPDRTSS